MNTCVRGPFRLNKIHVFLFWTPVATISYKLRLSACSLTSFSVVPSSSPFHSLSRSLSICLLPQKCESRLSHPPSSTPLPLLLLCPPLSLYFSRQSVSVCRRIPESDGTNMSWLSLVEADNCVCVLGPRLHVDVNGLTKTTSCTAPACCQAPWSPFRAVYVRGIVAFRE